MELKQKFVLNTAFYAIIGALVVMGWKYLLPVMMPFIIGFVVALVVQVPLNALKLQKPAHRKAAALVLCLAFYVGLVALGVVFTGKVIAEIKNFAASVPALYNDHLYPLVLTIGDEIQAILEPIDMSLAQLVNDYGKSVVSTLSGYATELSGWAVKTVASGAVSIPGVLLQIIITVVASFYMAADYRAVADFLKGCIPQAQRNFVLQVIRYAKTAVLVYIKSYSIMFCITFVELWAGLAILKVPYALGLSFGIAVFDLMPILGVGGILLPWSVAALVLGEYGMALGTLALYLVIAAVRHTIEPRIVGAQIGLPPLATLVAMVVGLNLAGLVGMMLLPITLVAITKIREGSTTAKQL